LFSRLFCTRPLICGEKYPTIPWSDIAGMRDILIHNYIEVDLDIVWKTATEDLPDLDNLLKSIKI